MKKSIFVVVLWSRLLLANVIGSDAQNFNPTTNGIDYVTVQSTETLEPGIFNVGLFANYAVNTLPYFPFSDSGVNQDRFDFNDYLLAGDLNFGLGISPKWDFGISLPLIITSGIETEEGVGIYTTGFTEIRLNTKYLIHKENGVGYAAIFTVNNNLIQDNPFSGRNAGPTFNLEMAVDKKIGLWSVAGNIGYRLRNSGEAIHSVLIDPYPNQYIASVAGSYLISQWDTKLILEVFSSYPDGSKGTNQTDRQLSSSELLGGFKWDMKRDLALHAGASTELVHGASAPDWRFYTGINWNFGERKQNANIIREMLSGGKLESIQLPGLQFISGTADVSKKSESTVDELVTAVNDAISNQKVIKIIIEGHTDSVGSDEVNKRLSKYRAETIRKAILKGTNLSAEIVESIGYGEDLPIADNGNYQGRAKNRRVEIKIQYRD